MLLHVCAYACSMHGYRPHVYYMRVPHVTIPHVVHDKLHETCMFHAKRKRGSHKHITGLLKVLLCCHTCTLVVIIEW